MEAEITPARFGLLGRWATLLSVGRKDFGRKWQGASAAPFFTVISGRHEELTVEQTISVPELISRLARSACIQIELKIAIDAVFLRRSYLLWHAVGLCSAGSVDEH